MAFPRSQHSQEIESVIVYVWGENVTAVFFWLLSAGSYLTPALHAEDSALGSQHWLEDTGGVNLS